MSIPAAKRTFQIERQLSAANGPAPVNGSDISKLDLRQVKFAIDDMRKEMRQLLGSAPKAAAGVDPESYRQQIVEAEKLRSDLEDLHNAIEKTKKEIASLRKRDTASDKISTASEALRAVVSDTEQATDGIINAAEAVEEIAGRLQATVEGESATQMVEELFEQVTAVFEHCNFQDITGQRITRVVDTMEYIDEKIQRMMVIWGGDEAFAEIEGDDDNENAGDEGETLHGPAMDGDASISQADIDALFD